MQMLSSSYFPKGIRRNIHQLAKSLLLEIICALVWIVCGLLESVVVSGIWLFGGVLRIGARAIKTDFDCTYMRVRRMGAAFQIGQLIIGVELCCCMSSKYVKSMHVSTCVGILELMLHSLGTSYVPA
jgi:hypothetical protein